MEIVDPEFNPEYVKLCSCHTPLVQSKTTNIVKENSSYTQTGSL